MRKAVVRRAQSDADFSAARALSFAWADWQRAHYPEHLATIDTVFEPKAYKRVVAQLHEIHARPGGAILLAELGGQTVGCVMYQGMAPGIAEIKRLFVNAHGRGHGLGQTLLSEAFDLMIADDYKTVRFSSARFLTHARQLYERLGFVETPPPIDLPANLSSVVYFMERSLTPQR